MSNQTNHDAATSRRSTTMEKRRPMQPEEIARVCHEANRAYCLALGDTSQPTWDDAPEWQRESAILGVTAHLGRKLTPAESHALWMYEKRANGWKYGPVKNPETKEHPCFVPYEELPLEQRRKDSLFGAVVEALKSV